MRTLPAYYAGPLRRALIRMGNNATFCGNFLISKIYLTKTASDEKRIYWHERFGQTVGYL